MTVLVLGGTGFIGQRVTRRLAERGEKVVCMDINRGAASFHGLEDRVGVMYGDITQFEDVVKAVLESKADRIINLAYMMLPGEHIPHFSMRLNVLGMDNCLEAARVCGVNRVVYASSIDVNGAQRHFGERLITEDDAKYGTTQYAVHKIFNEFVAAQYEKIYGMSIIGIRAANVTGHDKVRGSVDHVKCITLPAAEHPVSFPKKDYTRLPIHVQDVAEGFVRVTLADTVHHSLYNGGGTAISLGDLADMVRGFLPDAQISFDSDGRHEGDSNYLVDNSRLLEEFELEYPPFPTRVLEIINDVRRDAGLSLVS